LESLFFPIFKGIQDKSDYRFTVFQFSWAKPSELSRLSNLGEDLGINYVHQPISRDKGRMKGSLHALWQGRRIIKRMTDNEGYQLIMPRATMPAILVNSLSSFLKKRKIKVVFEADGFPIQERIDFSGLNPDSLQARFLLKQEKRMLVLANAVLTRSKKAIDIHVDRIGEAQRPKFYAAANGRNPDFFKFSKEKRSEIRKSLGLSEFEICWIYVGSLGPAYGAKDLMSLFDLAQKRFGNLHLLVLPNDLDYAKENLRTEFSDRFHILNVPFKEIPYYLSAADIGLNFRKNAASLLGIFPIKLGEYLLCGLPVLGSLNMGDAESVLGEQSFVLNLDLDSVEDWEEKIEKLPSLLQEDRLAIRGFALEHFSLDSSVNTYLEALNSL
jgi:Glycosyltransferase